MTRLRLLIAALAAVGFVSGSAAQHAGDEGRGADVRISNAHAFEFSENGSSVRVYLSIENRGDADDRLIDASVSFAAHVQLQSEALNAQRIPVVIDVEAITIEAGRPSRLYREAIQLDGIRKTFRYGQSFDMHLTFEKTGMVSVEVKVRARDFSERSGARRDPQQGRRDAIERAR